MGSTWRLLFTLLYVINTTMLFRLSSNTDVSYSTTLILFTWFKSFFPHAANLLHSTGGPGNSPTPDFNLRDSKDRTVLALAVWSGFYKVAAQLLNSGADINYRWLVCTLLPVFVLLCIVKSYEDFIQVDFFFSTELAMVWHSCTQPSITRIFLHLCFFLNIKPTSISCKILFLVNSQLLIFVLFACYMLVQLPSKILQIILNFHFNACHL